MKDWKVLTLVSFQVHLTVLKGRLCLDWLRRCLWTSKRTGPQFCVTEAVFRVFFFAETSHPNITNYFLCILFLAYNLLSLPFPDRAQSLGRIQNLGSAAAAPTWPTTRGAEGSPTPWAQKSPEPSSSCWTTPIWPSTCQGKHRLINSFSGVSQAIIWANNHICGFPFVTWWKKHLLHK